MLLLWPSDGLGKIKVWHWHEKKDLSQNAFAPSCRKLPIASLLGCWSWPILNSFPGLWLENGCRTLELSWKGEMKRVDAEWESLLFALLLVQDCPKNVSLSVGLGCRHLRVLDCVGKVSCETRRGVSKNQL